MLGLKKIIDTESLRKSYARVNVYDARSELGYQVKRNSVSAVVRKTADIGSHVIENSADAIGSLVTNTVGSILEFFIGHELASNLGLFAGTLGGNLAGIAGLGIAGGISAAFAQVDHLHQKNNLLALYREEIAARLGKDGNDVTVRDMEALAEENPVLKEELARTHKQRNFAIPLAVIATIASFAAVVFALPAVATAAGVTLPWVGAATFSWEWFGGVAAKMAISMSTYAAVKIPAQKLGNQLFGLLDETANDRIVDLKIAHGRGIEIQPADLMPVFIKTNPLLEKQIIDETGKPFEALSPQEQHDIALSFRAAPLETIARNINNGSVNTTELLFASVGEVSGVLPKPVEEEPQAIATPVQQATHFRNKFPHKNDKGTFTERVAHHAAAEAVTNSLH